MENIQLVDKDCKIIYANILKQYPWIVDENCKCILSPDCDGFLCGLLMSNVLGWNVAGYYDGKVLALEEGESVENCVFLDMEIFRNYVRSLGQHMVLWNKKDLPKNWTNFDNCISPNNIRGYDGKNHFPKKYPLGSIHLLLGIVSNRKKIDIKKEAICPLLYTDGTFKNLFNYPENCLSWLSFLCADAADSPLKTVFFNDHYTTSSLMFALRDFFDKLKSINKGSKGADKLKISAKDGEPANFAKQGSTYSVVKESVETIEKFLIMLDGLTGWKYDHKKWLFNNFAIYKFTKGTIKPNNRNFNELINKNPLSWAMTSGLAIEYTLEEPAKLPTATISVCIENRKLF